MYYSSYMVSRSLLVFLLFLETNAVPITSHPGMLLSTLLATTLARLPAHNLNGFSEYLSLKEDE